MPKATTKKPKPTTLTIDTVSPSKINDEAKKPDVRRSLCVGGPMHGKLLELDCSQEEIKFPRAYAGKTALPLDAKASLLKLLRQIVDDVVQHHEAIPPVSASNAPRPEDTYKPPTDARLTTLIDASEFGKMLNEAVAAGSIEFGQETYERGSDYHLPDPDTGRATRWPTYVWSKVAKAQTSAVADVTTDAARVACAGYEKPAKPKGKTK